MRIARALTVTAAAALVALPVGLAHATTVPVGDDAPPTERSPFLDFFLHQYAGAATDADDVTTSPDGSYTVRYPAAPSSTVQDAPLPGGGTVAIELLQLTTPDALYQTAFAEYPTGTATSLDVEIDSFMLSAQATLVSSEPIERGGREGRAFVGDQASGQATVVGITFLDGQRLWLAAVAVPGEVTADDPAVAEFLDSFQFTEGG